MNSISWMPSWVDSNWIRKVQVSALDDPLLRLPSPIAKWDCSQPLVEGWEPLTVGLKKAGARLRTLPIRRIVDAIGAATQQFRSRDSVQRREAVDAIRMATGQSEEIVQQSLDIEMDNYRSSHLWTALERDLGDPLVLDGFRADAHLGGLTRAFGPELVAAVATGNVPGLALLPVARSLMVKAPVLLKVARGEPTFAARLLTSLRDVDSEIADAVVITYWDASDTASLRGALTNADCVVVFGSFGAVDAIQKHLRPTQRVIVHGHKFSGGIVTQAHIDREGAEHVAERLAWDVSTFDQHACIAPKVFVVEGDEASVDAFGEVLASTLARHAADFPPGLLSAYDAASLAARRLAAGWDEACGIGRIWAGRGLGSTVVRSHDLPSVTCGGDRYVVLVPAPSPLECVGRLAEYSAHLQNVVVGATAEQLPMLAEELARLGACRVSIPGCGANPTMIWRHDGHACFADLVRWCDIEGLRTEPARI